MDELRKLTQYAESGESSAALYPPHQQWQHGGDAKRIGVPTGNPSSIWRALAAKVSGPHMSDKDAFNYPTAASTWHMLAADVYALAQQPVWSLLEATALRGLACRYSPELMGESAPPVPQQPKPAAVEALPVQPKAAAPAPVVAESASSEPSNGLATAQIAVIFDGLPYTAENWPKRASDINWLEPARVALGAAGGATSLWCPATLARLIHGRGRGAAKQKTLEALNKRFRSNPVLEPWRDAWNQHYEMFNDAD